MFNYFYGDDTYAARAAITRLATEKKAQLCWLDRKDLEERSLAARLSAGTTGLFGTDLLVVRDVKDFPKGLQTEVVAALEGDTGGEVVIWDRGQPDKRTAYVKKLRSAGREFSPLALADAVRWLVDWTRKHGGEITPGAARLLVEWVGVDRWRLSSEIEKLLLTSDEITEEQIKETLTAPAEAEIFAMLSALVHQQLSVALRHIEVLLHNGNSEFYILAMLAYQFRSLLIIRAGLEDGKRVHDIVREGKLKQYTVEKNLQAARTFSRQQLTQNLTRVLATDVAIKQGKVDARTGLLMLIPSLAQV